MGAHRRGYLLGAGGTAERALRSTSRLARGLAGGGGGGGSSGSALRLSRPAGRGGGGSAVQLLRRSSAQVGRRHPSGGSSGSDLRPPVRQTQARWCLGALATASWPCVPACGSLEPCRRGGENAQNTGKNGEEMGEIRPKTCPSDKLSRERGELSGQSGRLTACAVACTLDLAFITCPKFRLK